MLPNWKDIKRSKESLYSCFVTTFHVGKKEEVGLFFPFQQPFQGAIPLFSPSSIGFDSKVLLLIWVSGEFFWVCSEIERKFRFREEKDGFVESITSYF